MGCTVDLIPADAELDDVLRTLAGADGEFLGSVAGSQLAQGWPALLKTESYWLAFVPSNLSTPSPSNVQWSTLVSAAHSSAPLAGVIDDITCSGLDF